MEDTQAAIAYLRDPANATRLHADPNYIVLIGHSMGGMIAANIGAHDPTLRAIGHSYSDQRIALATSILNWLAPLPAVCNCPPLFAGLLPVRYTCLPLRRLP